MTQEEKFKEAKRLYETANADQRYVLESLFPELTESEDERISREITEFLVDFNNGEYERPNENTIDSWLSWLEKQDEQKPTDKVEPKFKVGDWVVSPNGVYWHIDAINNNRYEVSSTDGACADWPLDTDLYHLWTIQDAKAGAEWQKKKDMASLPAKAL